MKNILVTGGAGYIGSMLVPKLLDAGHKVTVIDNFMYNQTSLASLVSNKNLEIIFGDVRDYSLITKFISKSDVIIMSSYDRVNFWIPSEIWFLWKFSFFHCWLEL